jgi:hypothetical protein
MGILRVSQLHWYVFNVDIFAQVRRAKCDSSHCHRAASHRATCTPTDFNIGMILQALDDLTLTSRTIVTLIGDHGWELGEHGEWCKRNSIPTAPRSNECALTGTSVISYNCTWLGPRTSPTVYILGTNFEVGVRYVKNTCFGGILSHKAPFFSHYFTVALSADAVSFSDEHCYV